MDGSRRAGRAALIRILAGVPVERFGCRHTSGRATGQSPPTVEPANLLMAVAAAVAASRFTTQATCSPACSPRSAERAQLTAVRGPFIRRLVPAQARL